jgi:hypothetical protein
MNNEDNTQKQSIIGWFMFWFFVVLVLAAYTVYYHDSGIVRVIQVLAVCAASFGFGCRVEECAASGRINEQ